jgi:hypothetical protein
MVCNTQWFNTIVPAVKREMSLRVRTTFTVTVNKNPHECRTRTFCILGLGLV